MCTAACYKTKDFYFGRTLDYDFSYAEEVTVTPRNFPLPFKNTGALKTHYAIIGMAFVPDDYPLYYDAVNEKGLCMAGLNFVGNAYYGKAETGKLNLAQYEFIPYILGKCASVKEALKELEGINLIAVEYAKGMLAAQLHWIIADKQKAITVEFVKEGLKIYDNPVGVLTNNPPFDEQLFNLNNYMSLSPRDPENKFSDKLNLSAYSRGMGALGLPGDLSSQSRFVRAAFVKMNSVSGDGEEESVNQFFHILGSVCQPRGACIIGKDGYEISIYTSCCNAAKGIYYYQTYENHAVSAVDMHAENLDGGTLFRYPIIRRENITFQNK
ncbi:MAG: choloylglycine hydrolase [Clostridia bacterium]|nr:choloylglycine hydrolase [Clostridia bacterium]